MFTLRSFVNNINKLNQNTLRNLHLSVTSNAEPLKKKANFDPNMERNRLLKKKRRIEKEIRRLQKQGRILKPIDEIEVDRQLRRELAVRKREPIELSTEVVEERALLFKDWGRYCTKIHSVEERKLEQLINSQEKALIELRDSSEELYQAAVEVDDNIYALKFCGPYESAPNPTYDSPDGDYKDITNKFDYSFEIDQKLTAVKKKKKKF